MSEYVISVNSTVDLPKEWLEERAVPVIPLKYTIDKETYDDMSGLTSKEFFQKLREGKMAVTTQVNPEQAKEGLEKIVREGKDILHLAFSSGLSGTYNSMRIAAEELKEEYPERKIIVIDTLCACMGEGLLLYYALKHKKEGMSVEEERGRQRSIQKIVDMSVERSKGWDNEIIMITHGDCPEDAEYLAKVVREKMGVENILINNIGTVIGSHTGPGVLAVFHMGGKR